MLELGPCAKSRVTCRIRTTDGLFIHGENLCANPQPKCPRGGGEGYEKCKSVCLQIGHAEQVAAAQMRSMGKYGGTAMLDGHFYMCDNCLVALHSVGIKDVVCVDALPKEHTDVQYALWNRYVNADLSGDEVVFKEATE